MTALTRTGVKIAAVSGGVFLCGSSLAGYSAFKDTAAHKVTYQCVIEEPATGDWEKGWYVYDASLNTLTRVSVTSSTNSNLAITPSSDAIIYAGSALLSLATPGLSQGQLGYLAGVGGSVTQLTSKATAVTLNKVCGQIVTFNDSLTATAFFKVNNNQVAATDVVGVSVAAAGVTASAYRAWVVDVAAGSFTIGIENVSGGALAEAITLNFAVVKSVAA